MENQNQVEKKSKKKKGLLLLLLLLAFGICASVGVGLTLAKYASTGKVESSVTAATWKINLKNGTAADDKDISKQEATLTTTLKEKTQNNNVVDGKIAPGSECYAEFVIDPTGTEVAFDWSFTVDTNAFTGWTGVAVSKVVTVASDSTESTITANGGKYSGSVALASQTAAMTSDQKVTIRVYVKWTNSSPANDSADTTIGADGKTVKMTINLSVEQKVA